MVDTDDPGTWPGAVERWLAAHPELAPGRAQPPETAAFVVGYLSRLGLDTWAEQYLHDAFPAAARTELPGAWLPPAVADRERRRAALQALGEAPIPPQDAIDPAALERVPIPAGFPVEAIRTITLGIAPAMALTDAWAISRVNPLPGRARPDTPEARHTWEAARAALPPATSEENEALLGGALAFTLDQIRRWW